MTKKKFDDDYSRQKYLRRDKKYHQKNEKSYSRQQLKNGLIEDKISAAPDFA